MAYIASAASAHADAILLGRAFNGRRLGEVVAVGGGGQTFGGEISRTHAIKRWMCEERVHFSKQLF